MSFQSIVSEHRGANNTKAFQQLATTLLAYFIFLGLAVLEAHRWYIMLPAAAICGIAGTRLYMLQHDCMHRCFIAPRRLNDLIGILLSAITLTPFAVGRHNHNLHHSHVGDLDQRDSFEINVLTLSEYRSLSYWGRLAYRIYRSPVTLVLIGPLVVFLIFHRFPKNTLKGQYLLDVLIHNVLVLGFVFANYALAGGTGVWVWLLSVWVGVSFGAIIPFVEHNFEDVHWGRRPELTPQVAAFESTAVLDFGGLYNWITANIGFHDLHHFNPMIPSYALKDCHEQLEAAGLIKSRKVSIRDAARCFSLKLWDEDQARMVSFEAV